MLNEFFLPQVTTYFRVHRQKEEVKLTTATIVYSMHDRNTPQCCKKANFKINVILPNNTPTLMPRNTLILKLFPPVCRILLT